MTSLENRVLLFIGLFGFVIVSNCTSRLDRIATLSRSFQKKGNQEDTWRDGEVIELANLGTFCNGMSREEIESILGKPSAGWGRVSETETARAGYDEYSFYALSTVSGLYVQLLRGGLQSMYLGSENPPERGGGIIPIDLAKRKR